MLLDPESLYRIEQRRYSEIIEQRRRDRVVTAVKEQGRHTFLKRVAGWKLVFGRANRP